MKPIIGITSSIDIEEPVHRLHDANVQAILRAGGIPLILPNITDEEVIKEIVSKIDGLLGSGGYDVSPLIFGEQPHQKIGTITPLRDQFELLLFQEMLKAEKPIFGICRGMQMLNVAAGGNLYQDIYAQHEEQLIKHGQDAPRSYGSHFVSVKENTRLHEIVKEKQLVVNSYHHQAVKDVADNFIVSGTAPDGIIEAIESTEHPFAIGVQWHPEHMLDNDQPSVALFDAFIEACTK